MPALIFVPDDPADRQVVSVPILICASCAAAVRRRGATVVPSLTDGVCVECDQPTEVATVTVVTQCAGQTALAFVA